MKIEKGKCWNCNACNYMEGYGEYDCNLSGERITKYVKEQALNPKCRLPWKPISMIPPIASRKADEENVSDYVLLRKQGLGYDFYKIARYNFNHKDWFDNYNKIVFMGTNPIMSNHWLDKDRETCEYTEIPV